MNAVTATTRPTRAKMSISVLIFALATMVFGLPRVSNASEVLYRQADCTLLECFGAYYSLSIDDGGTDDNNYIAKLVVDTTDYEGTQQFISAVDFKVGGSVSSASLIQAPGSTDLWTTVYNKGQAGNACGGTANGFVTACDTVPRALHRFGWVTMDLGLDLLDHIGS
jgi:hypothetical protein